MACYVDGETGPEFLAASIQGQVATGERAGQPVRRRLRDPHAGIRTGPLCFASRGFSLHAATRVQAADRSRLERCAGTSIDRR